MLSQHDNDEILHSIEKSDEMRCDFNSKIKLDRIKFHEYSLEMFRKS